MPMRSGRLRRRQNRGRLACFVATEHFIGDDDYSVIRAEDFELAERFSIQNPVQFNPRDRRHGRRGRDRNGVCAASRQEGKQFGGVRRRGIARD